MRIYLPVIVYTLIAILTYKLLPVISKRYQAATSTSGKVLFGFLLAVDLIVFIYFIVIIAMGIFYAFFE